MKLAKLLLSNVKVQARVKQFVAAYLPEAPQPKPKFDGVDWDATSIEDGVGRIYRWRSDFLHAAIPFPGAMCDPPRREEDGAYTERPGGLGTGIGDATWLAEDTPMLLWSFAYLVSEVLRAWWIDDRRLCSGTVAESWEGRSRGVGLFFVPMDTSGGVLPRSARNLDFAEGFPASQEIGARKSPANRLLPSLTP
jgi:hypothetical protein